MTSKPARRRHTQYSMLALLLGASVLLSGCDSGSSPTQGAASAPDKADAEKDQRDRALLNAIQAPQDKARAVEGQVLDAAKKQQEQIDAQTGGD